MNLLKKITTIALTYALSTTVGYSALNVSFADILGGFSVTWTGNLDLTGTNYRGTVDLTSTVINTSSIAEDPDETSFINGSIDIYEFTSGYDISGNTINNNTLTTLTGNNFGFQSADVNSTIAIYTGFANNDFVSGYAEFMGNSVADLGINEGSISWGAGANQRINFIVAAVPEPSSLTLLGLAGGAAFIRKRRSK